MVPGARLETVVAGERPHPVDGRLLGVIGTDVEHLNAEPFRDRLQPHPVEVALLALLAQRRACLSELPVGDEVGHADQELPLRRVERLPRGAGVPVDAFELADGEVPAGGLALELDRVGHPVKRGDRPLEGLAPRLAGADDGEIAGGPCPDELRALWLRVLVFVDLEQIELGVLGHGRLPGSVIAAPRAEISFQARMGAHTSVSSSSAGVSCGSLR